MSAHTFTSQILNGRIFEKRCECDGPHEFGTVTKDGDSTVTRKPRCLKCRSFFEFTGWMNPDGKGRTYEGGARSLA